MTTKDLIGELVEAARTVVWFDWSSNDYDAVAAVDRLRACVEAIGSNFYCQAGGCETQCLNCADEQPTPIQLSDDREEVRRRWREIADKHAFSYNPEYLNDGTVSALVAFAALFGSTKG